LPIDDFHKRAVTEHMDSVPLFKTSTAFAR